jgi:hypothetical protein
MLSSENTAQWFSVSRVLNYVWQRAFTPSGACVALGGAASIAYTLRPPAGMADYIALPLIALFVLFLVSLVLIITAAIGDGLAEWLLTKIVKKPDPGYWSHQVVYILCSIICMCVAILFVACIRYH